jgi:Zn-dependent M16 (insulinase) family peptidase
LREKLSTDYYEKLLCDILINNPTRVKLKMIPSPTLTEKRQLDDAERLNAIATELGEAGLAEIERIANELKSAQAEEDSEEARSKIPKLKISDITASPEFIPSESTDLDGIPVLYTDISTSGISYLSLYFDATDTSAEDMLYLRCLISLFEEVPTENYTALTLQNYIRKNLGSFSTHLTRLTSKSTGKAKAYVSVSASALDSKISDVITVLKEVLLGSSFDDKTTVKNLLKQMLLISEEAYKTSGHTIAINRASAFTDVEGTMGEYYSGYEYYRGLKKLSAEIDECYDEFREKLYGLCRRLFVSERMTVTLAGVRNEELIKSIISAIPKRGERKALVSPIKPLGIRREGILAPVQAAFTATAVSLAALGRKYFGAYVVARSLLSYGHLWNTVRIQGGAYGVGLIVRTSRPNATVGFYSYRDPSPARTLQCFAASGDALRKIVSEGEDLTSAIIGAVGDATPLLSTKLRASVSSQRFLRGTTYEDLTEMLDEILKTDRSGLEEVADALDEICEKNGAVIVADKERLDSCRLDSILKI